MSFNGKIKYVKLGMAMTMFFSSISANANTTLITTIRDWSLWETTTDKYSVCFIETSDSEGNTFIRITKTKNNPADPAEMMVRLNQNPRGSTGMLANIKGAPQVAFADMDGSKTTFWGLPKSITAFTQQIHGAKENLKVKGVGGKKDNEVTLSSQGYKYIIEEMQKRCNNGQSILSPEFEQEVLSSIPDGVDPTRIDVTKQGELRGLYYASHRALNEIKVTKAELAQLLSKYQGFIDELATNRASAKQIEESSLPQAKADLQAALTRQSEARTELARIETLIPGLTAKIQKSQQVLDAAQAILAPLIPEHDRLASGLSSAQSVLGEAQNRLSYVDSRLRDGAQQLNSLRSEADSISSWLPQKRSDRDRASWNYRDAQNRRSQYNVSWERDQRLRNNFEYGRLRNDRDQMISNQRQAEMDAQRIRVERDRVARELQQCRMGMVAEINLTQVVDLEAAEPRPPGVRPGPPGGGGLVPGPRPPPPPGGGGGLVPGPRPPGPGPGPGPGPRPPEPPRPPVRDCSHLERALQVANQQVAEREQAARNYAARVHEINSRMDSIENQIEWEVRREYDSLVAREEQFRREFEQLDRDVANSESRLSQITNSDIPRLENEQRSLQNERPSVVSRINQAQSDVNRLSQELARFEAANNWDSKVSAVNAASSQLAQDQANLNSVLGQKRAAQAKLDQNIALAAQAQERISSLNAQLAGLNQRAGELNELLKNLPSERAPLDAKITSLQNDVNNAKARLADLLK